MTVVHFLQLLLLAAIWGASFLFMRIAVPALGPVWLIEGRIGLAALFLLVMALVLGRRLQLRQHWRHYLIVGGLNSALPFLLFAYAAQSLTGSLLSVLNATAPIWGVTLAMIWHKTPVSPKTWLGLGLGLAGVYVLVAFDAQALGAEGYLAVAAALLAPFSYALVSLYVQSAKQVDSFATAHGGMWLALLLLTPLLPLFPMHQVPAMEVWWAVLALGVLCTGAAFMIYFRLIAEVGAAPALTVTYLIPLFGIVWGHSFLGEPIGWHMILGAAAVLLGTALVTGFSPRLLRSKRLAEIN